MGVLLNRLSCLRAFTFSALHDPCSVLHDPPVPGLVYSSSHFLVVCFPVPLSVVSLLPMHPLGPLAGCVCRGLNFGEMPVLPEL